MELSQYIVDSIILAVIVISALLAMSRGFVREFFSIVAWVGSFILAFTYYDDFTPMVTQLFGINQNKIAEFVSGVSIFLLALLILQLVAIGFSALIKGQHIGFINRLFGFLFGVGRGVAILCSIYLLYSMVIKIDKQPEMIKNAHSRPLLVWGGHMISQIVPSWVWEKMENRYDDPSILLPYDLNIVTQPGTPELKAIPPTKEKPAVQPGKELPAGRKPIEHTPAQEQPKATPPQP